MSNNTSKLPDGARLVPLSVSTKLEERIDRLSTTVIRLQASNSELQYEVDKLKNNYNVLVEEMSARLEAIHDRFRSKG